MLMLYFESLVCNVGWKLSSVREKSTGVLKSQCQFVVGRDVWIQNSVFQSCSFRTVLPMVIDRLSSLVLVKTPRTWKDEIVN